MQQTTARTENKLFPSGPLFAVCDKGGRGKWFPPRKNKKLFAFDRDEFGRL